MDLQVSAWASPKAAAEARIQEQVGISKEIPGSPIEGVKECAGEEKKGAKKGIFMSRRPLHSAPRQLLGDPGHISEPGESFAFLYVEQKRGRGRGQRKEEARKGGAPHKPRHANPRNYSKQNSNFRESRTQAG